MKFGAQDRPIFLIFTNAPAKIVPAIGLRTSLVERTSSASFASDFRTEGPAGFKAFLF